MHLPPEYLTPLERLFALNPTRIDLGLERFSMFLDYLGNPHQYLPVVLVAGTNGKGSTVAFLESILRAAKIRTARYTSPHLERVTERITLGGNEISIELLQEYAERVLDAVAEVQQLHPRFHLTFFEALTAAAIMSFADYDPEIVVVEVGLGGRLDATNILHPLHTIITTIDYDHTQILGTTLAEITREKAGILRPGVALTTAVPAGRFNTYLWTHCLHLGVEVRRYASEFSVEKHSDSVTFTSDRQTISDLCPALTGTFQLANLGTAIDAAMTLDKTLGRIDEAAIRQGVAKTVWPGRLEVISTKPLILLDGAHNREAWIALRESLKESLPYNRCHLVVALKNDKDSSALLKALAPLNPHAVLTTFPETTCRPPQTYLEAALQSWPQAEVVENPERALEQALTATEPDDLLLITGSLYLIGHLRPLLLARFRE